MTKLSITVLERRTAAGRGLRAFALVLAALLVATVFSTTVLSLAGCAGTESAESADASGSSAVPADGDGSTGSATAEPGVLLVASTLANDPYERETSTGQNGFTCDLLELIGEKTGMTVKFGRAVNHKADDQSITTGTPADVAARVAAGEADLGASSLSVDEPLEGVAFTEPYLHADLVLMTKMGLGNDDAASLEKPGVIVAVGSQEAADWVAQRLPEAEVVAFDSDVDAIMEVNSERAAAAVVDEPRFRRYVKVKEPHLQIVETAPLSTDYAFAVASGNDDLADAVNGALAELQADGSYDALYDAWFGEAPKAGTATHPAPEAVQDSTGA